MESSRQSRATLVIFTSDNGADLNARERAGEACQVPHLALVSEWVGVDSVHVAHAQGQVAHVVNAQGQVTHVAHAQGQVDPSSVASRRPLKEVRLTFSNIRDFNPRNAVANHCLVEQQKTWQGGEAQANN